MSPLTLLQQQLPAQESRVLSNLLSRQGNIIQEKKSSEVLKEFGITYEKRTTPIDQNKARTTRNMILDRLTKANNQEYYQIYYQDKEI